MKFKDKKGLYESLPSWIKKFENEIRIQIENVIGNMKDMNNDWNKKQQESNALLTSTFTNRLKSVLADQKAAFENDLDKVQKEIKSEIENVKEVQHLDRS